MVKPTYFDGMQVITVCSICTLHYVIAEKVARGMLLSHQNLMLKLTHKLFELYRIISPILLG